MKFLQKPLLGFLFLISHVFLLATEVSFLKESSLFYREHCGPSSSSIAYDFEGKRLFLVACPLLDRLEFSTSESFSTPHLVRCLDFDRRELWKYEADGPAATIVYDQKNKKIFFGTTKSFCCLDSEGHLLWKYFVGGKVTEISYHDQNGSAFCVSRQEVGQEAGQETGSHDTLHCINAKGEEVWQWSPGPSLGQIATDSQGDRVFCISDSPSGSTLHCFDFEGKQVWDHKSAVKIYGISYHPLLENVFYGSADGKLHCLDAQKNVVWTSTLEEDAENYERNIKIVFDDHDQRIFFAFGETIYCTDFQGKVLCLPPITEWSEYLVSLAYDPKTKQLFAAWEDSACGSLYFMSEAALSSAEDGCTELKAAAFPIAGSATDVAYSMQKNGSFLVKSTTMEGVFFIFAALILQAKNSGSTKQTRTLPQSHTTKKVIECFIDLMTILSLALMGKEKICGAIQSKAEQLAVLWLIQKVERSFAVMTAPFTALLSMEKKSVNIPSATWTLRTITTQKIRSSSTRLNQGVLRE